MWNLWPSKQVKRHMPALGSFGAGGRNAEPVQENCTHYLSASRVEAGEGSGVIAGLLWMILAGRSRSRMHLRTSSATSRSHRSGTVAVPQPTIVAVEPPQG